MFDKFGEYSSIEELNEKAGQLKTEGKEKELREFAEENGFEDYVADMFLTGEIPALCPEPSDAALAKLEVEKGGTDITGIIKDWIAYIQALCVDDEGMARAVRKKGKSLKGCIADLMLYSLQNQKAVDADILQMVEKKVKAQKIDLKKTAGIEERWLKYTKIGIMDMGQAKKLIRAYYMEG